MYRCFKCGYECVKKENSNKSKTVSTKATKRTYATRALVNPVRMSDDDAVNDAADMEFRDYSTEASSYVEAMGKYMGDMVQNYAFNMCVKYFQTYIEFFEDMANMDDEAVQDIINNTIGGDFSIEDTARLKEMFKERWQEVPVPVEYTLKILAKILEDIKNERNLLQWQEPELVIMGNPNLVENMVVKAETVEDYANNGIENLAKFMVDFGTKSKGEEE